MTVHDTESDPHWDWLGLACETSDSLVPPNPAGPLYPTRVSERAKTYESGRRIA